jgi:nucleoside-diphosphate-sugar epimerase
MAHPGSPPSQVAVLGATGNVGTALVRHLGADGAIGAVRGLARRAPAWSTPGVTFGVADVVHDDLEAAFAGAEAVVHLAWRFQPTHRPMTTWEANVIGSRRVLDAAAAVGVRTLVVASSIGAYSPGQGRAVDEGWPTHSVPTAAYGREKAYLERMLDAFELAHPEVRVVRMRPAFIFQRAAASEQRRIFAGPLVPGALARPGALPVLPLPAGLRFQVVHADDVAEAIRLALLGDARGAFNLATGPVVDGALLAEVLQTRVVDVPRRLVRAAVATGWHLRAVPADPALLDLFLSLPLMDTARARVELDWEPRHDARTTLGELVHGMAEHAGMETPPLEPDSPAARLRELANTATGG